jgi:1-acyl-sn-glycerol-3-phosphate acyltransferase
MSSRPVSYSYRVGQFLGLTILGSAGAKIRGKEKIPSSGSVLLVSNHQSFLDPLFVSLAYSKRQIHFMAKEELYRTPISRHMMMGLGAFPVNRDGPSKSTLIQVFRLLKDGRCLCLFAEGTRSKDGELREFQSGFAKIARRTRTPVVPIAMTGTRNLFEDLQGMSLPIWSRIIGYPPPVLSVGEPVSCELPAEEIARQTHDRVRALLEECRGA